MYGNKSHGEIRIAAVKEMAMNPTKYKNRMSDAEWNAYLENHRKSAFCSSTSVWADENCMKAIANCFGVTIVGYNVRVPDLVETFAPEKNTKKTIHLIYWDNLHFDSVIFGNQKTAIVQLKPNDDDDITST